MSAPTHAGYLATPRFRSLDGVRCLAILPVIWHHSTPRPLPGVLGRGPLGVHLFFAVSGFLITTLLLRERRQTGGVDVGAFFARRTLRIFPLYYAVLALYVLRALLVLPESPLRAHFFRSLPFYATYTTNWFVDYTVPHPVIFGFSWSLATEEQFYAVWPWAIRRFRSRATLMLGAIVPFLLDAAAEHDVFRTVLGNGLALRIVTSISAPICLGALLAIVLDDRRGFDRLARVLGQRLSAPLLLAALAGLVAWDGAPLFALHAAMALLVASVCVREDHGLRRVLELPLVEYVGKVSYGLYLFHVAAITAVKWALPVWATSLAVFSTATLASLGAAALSYRYFERPFLELRERFRAEARDARRP